MGRSGQEGEVGALAMAIVGHCCCSQTNTRTHANLPVVVRHSTVQALVRVWLMGVQSEVAVVVVVGGGDGYGSHLAAIVIWRGTNWDGTCLRIQFRRQSHVAGGDAVVADSQLGSLVSGCDTVGAGCSYDRRRSKSSLNSQL